MSGKIESGATPTTFSSESERLHNPPPEPTELAKLIAAHEKRLTAVEEFIKSLENKRREPPPPSGRQE